MKNGVLNFQFLGSQTLKDFPLKIKQGSFYLTGQIDLAFLKNINVLVYF